MKKKQYKLPDKPMLYIAYGSNINLGQMAYRCPHSNVIAEVPGLLWKLDPRDIPTLNRYEGFPNLYRQEEIKLKYNGQTVKGMAYLMNRGSVSPPSQQYLQTIWDGYKANGMDTSYLVETAARAYDHASEMNITFDEDYDPELDEDTDFDDDVQMAFKF